MSVVVTDAIAQQLLSRYDDDAFLGFCVWYYVPASYRIDISEWIEATVNTPIYNIVPKAPTRVNMFKRAVMTAREKSNRYQEEDDRFKLIVSDAGYDDDRIYREVSVERLDQSKNRVSFDTVVRFTFDKRKGLMNTPEIYDKALEKYPDIVRGLVEDKIDDVITEFFDLRGKIDAIKIRELIKKDILDGMYGVPVKESGSIFFVFREVDVAGSQAVNTTERLFAIDKLFKETLHGCAFHILPVPDDENQRAMVKGAYEQDCISEVVSFMDKMRKMLQSGSYSKREASEIFKRFHEMKDRTTMYAETLGESYDNAHARLELMQRQLHDLFLGLTDGDT